MARMRLPGLGTSLFALSALVAAIVYALPAYAQIETVVVTAERKSEDIQKIPVSVTALTSKDLKAKQVTNFRDLQFHVPSVTYTKSNFGGAQFQIRGITTQFGLGAAVAQNFDDVFLEAPLLVTGEYYDVDRVEVARGPQSTSYGRAATGGAVNVISTKPDLDNFQARASIDYGAFNEVKPDAMINVPIIDGQLGFRLALHGSWHSGYEQNVYLQLNQPDIFKGSEAGGAEDSANSLGVMSGRGSLRWQPNDDTTIDLVADVQFENDRRTRGDKQMCHFDPAGIIGCLPDKLGFEPFNTAATIGTSLGSAQGITAALTTALCVGGPVSGAGLPSGGGCGTVFPQQVALASAQLIGNSIGLCSIAGNGAAGDPQGAGAVGQSFLGFKFVPAGPAPGLAVVPQTPAGATEATPGVYNIGTNPNSPCTGNHAFVSQDILKTNTPFSPKYLTAGQIYLMNWSQTITSWLKATTDIGLATGYQFTQQDFTDSTHENIGPEITQGEQGFDIVFGGRGYPGVGGTSGQSTLAAVNALGIPTASLPAALQTALTGQSIGALAHNAPAYDAVYFDQLGELPISNVHYTTNRFGNYGGIVDTSHCRNGGAGQGPFGWQCGILLKSAYNISYDEDYFVSREYTGEVRLQTDFKGPLNFSSGFFYMSEFLENQYWVVANSLDWEAAMLGAFLTPCVQGKCSLRPYVLAMPTFDAEARRFNVQSRSAFLEGTYEFLDDFKFILGARFNDDRASFWRAAKCAGGGLFGVNAANPMPNASGPCDGTQHIQPDPNAPIASDPVYGGNPPTAATTDQNLVAGLTSLYPIGSTQVFLKTTTKSPTFITGKSAGVNDLWTGRASLNWSPKLDWTDQTLLYVTASVGELAGGVNTPNNGAQSIVPTVYKPAVVDALEVGTKNTLLDNSLTANLTAWYYNYTDYQAVVIANRQALELNIPANLYGLEGEFLWAPMQDLAFNLTLSATHSAVGHVFLQDERNPTNNQHGVTLVRDLLDGQICAVTVAPGNPKGLDLTLNGGAGPSPGDSNSTYHVNNFYLPQGGNPAVDAPFGIPLANYGLCTGPGSVAQKDLLAHGFDYTFAINPKTGKPVPAPAGSGSLSPDGFLHDGTGIARDLHGNQLPQVPFAQVGIGAQYTFHLDDISLVPRIDYYWQSHMESRIWNDPVIDRMGAWDVMNAQVQLSQADAKWYVQAFVKNVFDKHNPTGQYLQDPAAGTYTNVFSEDPRTFGFSIGDAW